MLFPPTLMTKLWQKCLELASDEDKLLVSGSRDLSWVEKVGRSKVDIAHANNTAINLERADRESLPKVYRIMNEIAEELGQPTPALYSYDRYLTGTIAVAFVESYSVGVHKEVEGLSDEGLKSLLAHEFSHFFDKNLEYTLVDKTLKLRDREDNSPAERVLWSAAFIASELLFYRRLRSNENMADGLSAYFTKEGAQGQFKEQVELFGRLNGEYQNEHNKDGQRENDKLAPELDKDVQARRFVTLKDIPILRRYARSHPSDKSRLADMEKGTYVDRAVKQIMGDSGERTK